MQIVQYKHTSENLYMVIALDCHKYCYTPLKSLLAGYNDC